jgi:hypothetical protein
MNGDEDDIRRDIIFLIDYVLSLPLFPYAYKAKVLRSSIKKEEKDSNVYGWKGGEKLMMVLSM